MSRLENAVNAVNASAKSDAGGLRVRQNTMHMAVVDGRDEDDVSSSWYLSETLIPVQIQNNWLPSKNEWAHGYVALVNGHTFEMLGNTNDRWCKHEAVAVDTEHEVAAGDGAGEIEIGVGDAAEYVGDQRSADKRHRCQPEPELEPESALTVSTFPGYPDTVHVRHYHVRLVASQAILLFLPHSWREKQIGMVDVYSRRLLNSSAPKNYGLVVPVKVFASLVHRATASDPQPSLGPTKLTNEFKVKKELAEEDRNFFFFFKPPGTA